VILGGAAPLFGGNSVSYQGIALAITQMLSISRPC
jgi:hypothetical protein